jgi:hypothetical protein
MRNWISSGGLGVVLVLAAGAVAPVSSCFEGATEAPPAAEPARAGALPPEFKDETISPREFVARALALTSRADASALCSWDSLTELFDRKDRLDALHEAILDPARRQSAFRVARGISQPSQRKGCLLFLLMSDEGHRHVARILADAVVLDPTLIGAKANDSGKFEIAPFNPKDPQAAYQYDRGYRLDLSANLKEACYVDVPAQAAIPGAEQRAVRLNGTILHADGRRTKRTIRFEPHAWTFDGGGTNTVWFVPEPTPDPKKWTIEVDGEIAFRFVSDSLRDEKGEPRSCSVFQKLHFSSQQVVSRLTLP